MILRSLLIMMALSFGVLSCHGKGRTLEENTFSEIRTSMNSTLIVRATTGPTTNATYSTGTGVFVAPDIILTNYHVIDNKSFYYIITVDNHVHTATLVGYNEAYDIALVQINYSYDDRVVGWRTGDIKIGEEIYIIGHPLGLNFSYARGYVSHPNRSLYGSAARHIQIDASINFGNSGGPLFDMDGNIIGIVNSIPKNDLSNGGIGFAIDGIDVLKITNSILQSNGLPLVSSDK